MDRISAGSPLPPIAEALKSFQPGRYRLGEVLLGQSKCSLDDIASALERQKSTPRRIGELLVESGACTHEQIAQALRLQAIASDPFWSRLGNLAWHPDMRLAQLTGGMIAGVPRYGAYVRFDSSEHALACLLVSESTYARILERAWQDCGMLVTPEQVVNLAHRLLEAGLITDPAREATAPKRPRSMSDYLQWRYPLYDPSALLERLASLLRLSATWTGLVLVWLPLVVLALATAGMKRSLLLPQVASVFQPSDWHALFALYPWLVLTLFVHEFGHAAVCYALGGPVHQMGLMLYMGMPFAYCDVSSAHLLPRRRDRIAVSLGGLYYQIALLAIATLAWGLLPLDPFWRGACVRLIALASGSILFDLNPFAKLDGYFVLADALNVPNLRDRSFAYLRSRLTGHPTEPVTRRQGYLFLGYGVIGTLMTGALLLIGGLWWSHELPRLFHGVLPWLRALLGPRSFAPH